MGESADMMINGLLCQSCGTYIDDTGGTGYPRDCNDCTSQYHYNVFICVKSFEKSVVSNGYITEETYKIKAGTDWLVEDDGNYGVFQLSLEDGENGEFRWVELTNDEFNKYFKSI